MEHKAGSGTGSISTTATATGKKMDHIALAASSWAVSKDHALELGRLFLETSLIEGSLEDLIWKLSGMSPAKGAVITQMMSTKIKRFKIIGLLKHPDLIAGIKPLWDQADPIIVIVTEYRNKFAHGVTYSNNPSARML